MCTRSNLLSCHGNQACIYPKAGMKRVLECNNACDQLGPVKKMLIRSQELCEGQESGEIVSRASVIVNCTPTKQLQHHENLSCCEGSDTQQLILQRLNMALAIQQQHSKLLSVILYRLLELSQKSNIPIAHSQQVYDGRDYSLPETMRTIEELEDFEHRLQTNDKYREKAISILVKLGGQDMKQSVRLMLDRLVHDNLACQFSFSGKRGKYTFSAYTNIIGVLLGSCCRQIGNSSHVNPVDLKDYLIECLKNASDRVLKRQTRSCSKSNHRTAIDAYSTTY